MLKKIILILCTLFIVSSLMTIIDSGTIDKQEFNSISDENNRLEEKDNESEVEIKPNFINIKNDVSIKEEKNIKTEEEIMESIEDENINNILETEESIKKEKSFIVAIDAGHQLKGNNEKEPIGPGALESKPKVSSGTTGIITKKPEYELTLEISLKLKESLIKEGYEVIMIRETNDVNISNAERAKIANDSNADIFIRIHANGSEDSSVKGITTLCPSPNNEYCEEIALDSYNLSEFILENLIDLTKEENLGVSEVDNMTGINYCEIPVSIVEVGFMTNPETDKLLETEDYQNKIVEGIVNGINKYFNGR